ncbi:MAG: aspartate kinase [Acidobacteriota bacterium]|nr:aspartate kinase [Acidobacteriota bacterium]
MALVVQKYGGTSLASSELILGAARRVVERRRTGASVVVVVSAMGDTTDGLVRLGQAVSRCPAPRELDRLLGTGETASAALLAMAIDDLGWTAVSLDGGEAGIRTNDVHNNARIVEVRTQRLRHELAAGRVVVVTGFQGKDSQGELTTLGRSGSDTSAVALAAALGADQCEIFTDVDGVFSSDPRIVAGARLLGRLRLEEMEELAWQGGRVVKAEAVELARDSGVSLWVGAASGEGAGTWMETGPEETFRPRRPPVSGVSARRDLIRITVPEDLSSERRKGLLDSLAAYDLIFVRGSETGALELYVSIEEIPAPEELRRELPERWGACVETSELLGAVSLVGFGLGSRPAALAAALSELRALGSDGRPLEVLATFSSRESFSFVLPVAAVAPAMERLHRAFLEELPWVPPAAAGDGADERLPGSVES